MPPERVDIAKECERTFQEGKRIAAAIRHALEKGFSAIERARRGMTTVPVEMEPTRTLSRTAGAIVIPFKRPHC